MPFERNRQNLIQVYKAINQATQAAGRLSGSVSLLAVSKNQPQEAILPLLEAGHRYFGENRVQEASEKWPFLQKTYPDIQLHLIGPLQTNKVRDALEIFDVIETVDRSRLVLALAREWKMPNRKTQKIFIQVNTGNEQQKSGVSIHDLPNLVELCLINQLPLTGFMCIPPIQDDPAQHFQLLCDLAQKYALKELSMGMSRDYTIAIEKGATWVRVGTALWTGV